MAQRLVVWLRKVHYGMNDEMEGIRRLVWMSAMNYDEQREVRLNLVSRSPYNGMELYCSMGDMLD